MVAYQVRVYNRSGALVQATDQFRSFSVEHRVNHTSTLTLAVAEDDAITAYVNEDDGNLDNLVEIRRQVPEAGLAWYTEYIGFHRTAQRQLTTGDQRILTSYGRGLLDLIGRRSIRHYADTLGSAKGPDPADDVIKDYVRENAGSSATLGGGPAPGRVTNGVTTGLAVAADLGQAVSYEGAHAWRNLLDAVRDIGEANSVDFDVAWLGGASFEFRTYYPRLGTDRRSGVSLDPMTFSPTFANMENPSRTKSRTEEVTSVLVLGPGEGPLRDTTLRTNAVPLAHSPWNLIETDYDQSNEDRTLALQKAGDSVLYEKRALVSFVFNVIQTPGSTYHKHYALGDLVTAQFSGVTSNLKIRAVTLSIGENSQESVNLTLEEMS